MGVWRHLLAIVALPGLVTVIIPSIVVSTTGSTRIGWELSGPFRWLPVLLGCALIAVGFVLVVSTIALFVRAGRGTLAPWDPTQRLVVRGVYRFVRNPMISGVLFILLGEATLAGARALLYWFLFFLALNAVYIPFIEEPGLVRRFGTEYLRYRENVPRWIPRLRPWQPPSGSMANLRR